MKQRALITLIAVQRIAALSEGASDARRSK